MVFLPKVILPMVFLPMVFLPMVIFEMVILTVIIQWKFCADGNKYCNGKACSNSHYICRNAQLWDHFGRLSLFVGSTGIDSPLCILTVPLFQQINLMFELNYFSLSLSFSLPQSPFCLGFNPISHRVDRMDRTLSLFLLSLPFLSFPCSSLLQLDGQNNFFLI